MVQENNDQQSIGVGKLLKQSEEKQKIILQNVIALIFIVNTAEEIHYINHEFPGHTENDMLGLKWLLWLDIKDRTKGKETLQGTDFF